MGLTSAEIAHEQGGHRGGRACVVTSRGPKLLFTKISHPSEEKE